jgi:hypothetical protein
MQINPYSPLLKESFKYLGWVVLFFVLWFNGCSNKEKSVTTTTVTVPEVKGNFSGQKPKHEPIVINNNANGQKGSIITIENPIDEKLLAENEKLKNDFAKANDSIQKLQFAKAIALNKFSTTFDDENITLNINGIVQGEVKEVTPSYTIKPKKVEVQVKPKETVFRLLGGVDVGNNTKLDGFAVKANLMFQNRKGNVLTTSFDTNQTIWLGYNISILNIKR